MYIYSIGRNVVQRPLLYCF